MTCGGSACRLAAFSLIELLVVVAIIGLLAAASGPVVRSMVSSQSIDVAGNELAALVETAKLEAALRDAPVWMGFASRVKDGRSEVLASLVASRDGSYNPGAANLVPVKKPIVLRDMTLISGTDLLPATRALVEPSRMTQWKDVATASPGANFELSGVTYNQTITFTPVGEAMLKPDPGADDGFDPVIGLALRETRGANSPPNAQELAFAIDGGSGVSSTYRIK